jgi:uncharacterized membrane protein YoaK (UPF0700 family)
MSVSADQQIRQRDSLIRALVCLTAVSGFVDAVGFLGRVFVGNIGLARFAVAGAGGG